MMLKKAKLLVRIYIRMASDCDIIKCELASKITFKRRYYNVQGVSINMGIERRFESRL